MTPSRFLVAAVFVTVGFSACKSGSGNSPGRLAFGNLPPPLKAKTILPPVTVIIEDSAGHPSTSATNPVTLYLEANPPGAALFGTLTRNAVAGVATFNDLSINIASDQFQFAAFSPGFTPGVSDVFTITPPTGALLPVPGSPFDAGDTMPATLTVDRAGKFLYVGNRATSSIGGFAISSAGALSAVPGSPFASFPSSTNNGLTVDSSGQYVIGPDNTFSNIQSYSIATAGNLASVSSAGSNGNVFALVSDPVAPVVFAANGFNATVTTYSVAADGTLAQMGSSISPAGQPALALAIDPLGKFLFVLTNQSLQVFTISPTGVLTATANSYPAGGNNGGGLAVDHTGKYVYVANAQTADVFGYAIASDGSLTVLPGSPYFGGGASRLGLAADPVANFIYMYSANVRVIQAVVTSSGDLASVAPSVSTDAVNTAITVDPQGRFAFVANSSGKIFVYSIVQ